jgi:hypothetical protein
LNGSAAGVTPEPPRIGRGVVHAAPPPAAQTPIRLATPPHTTITLPTAREPATTPRTSHPCPHRSLPAIRFLIRLVIAIRPCWSSRRAWRQYSKDLSSTLASLWTQSCPLVGRGPRDRLLGAMSRTQPAVVSAVRFESAGWSCRSFGDGRGLDGAVFDRQPFRRSVRCSLTRSAATLAP